MTPIMIGIACNQRVRERYLGEADLHRLGRLGPVIVREFDVAGPLWQRTPEDPAAQAELARFAAELDVLVVCHGAPFVNAAVLAGAPRLRMVGELEGDRFAGRVDLDAAAAAGVLVVDTTHSSSWPVAEWALALSLIGLRQHGRFREIIAGADMSPTSGVPVARELTGRTVGLIGFGHIAWRLRELLTPFRARITAYDPYAPRELADALAIEFAALDRVMTADVVVCLAPATPRSTGMIGTAELALLRPDAVFVNVSRGVVVDVDALIARATVGDAWFGLDAHDPEPIAINSPLRAMPNVFLSPHLGGVTAEAGPRFFTLMVDEIERLVDGREPRAQLTARVSAGRTGADRVRPGQVAWTR